MTAASNLTFGIALGLYLASMVGYFHFLAFGRSAVRFGARGVALAGIGVHLTSVVLRGIADARVPWGNMYEYATVVGLLVVAAYLVAAERRIPSAGGFVLGTAVLVMAAATMIYVPPGPLVPALNSYWLKIHVVAAMLGSSLFTLGFVFTVLYLVRDRRGRRPGVRASVPERALVAVGAGERPEDYAAGADEAGEGAGTAGPVRRSRLPAAAVLDRMAYRTIAFAFPIWTFAIIAGALWAEQAWGRYWGWDPKETWSFVTWVVFAGYLHARATIGWKGRRAAVLAMVGFTALVFNLIVVNLVLAGLHSYAT